MSWEALPDRSLSKQELRELVDTLAERPELWRKHVAHSSDQRHYASLYARPGAMHAAFNQFAAFTQDATDNKALAAKGKLTMPVLALGGDQSPAGARAAYESWSPFLKRGGTIAIHNSSPREYDPTHDGNRRIVIEEIVPPMYTDIRLVVHTTFARRFSH